uniref:Uncharacterized protein n=1 Tax=Opuntia streptacantha TaxID=393608 RepID=A0A7C9DCD0_OPUST
MLSRHQGGDGPSNERGGISKNSRDNKLEAHPSNLTAFLDLSLAATALVVLMNIRMGLKKGPLEPWDTTNLCHPTSTGGNDLVIIIRSMILGIVQVMPVLNQHVLDTSYMQVVLFI